MPHYKYCIVPKCTNTSTSTPEKLFFNVPRDLKVRKKWCTVMKRDDKVPLSGHTVRYCCEDHFDVEADMDNYVKYKLLGGKLRLKKGVLPHKFDCQKTQKNIAERRGSKKSSKMNRDKKGLFIGENSSEEQLKREGESIEDPGTKTNEPDQDSEPEGLVASKSSNDNGDSSQGSSDLIFGAEGMESVMDTSQNNKAGNSNGGGSEQSDGIFDNTEIEYVMVPQHEETIINIDSDESLVEPNKTQPSHSKPMKNKKLAILQHKIALRNRNIASLVKKIATQNKRMENQDKRIATQDKLIEKQEKTIENLKGQIAQLELKNDKLTKRNEYLRGSVQRLRGKILTDSELEPIQL